MSTPDTGLKTRWWLVAAVTAVALLMMPVAAQATNSVPYADSFESYAAGTGLADSTNWYGPIVTGLVVRTMPNTYPLQFPLPDASHSNVVELIAPVTNLLNHAFGDTNIWIDCVVNPVRSLTVPEVDNDIQLALYFNSNGHAVVRHAWYDAGFSVHQGWTELQHAPLPTGQWARVTIKMDYRTSDIQGDGSEFDKYFEIYLNGGAAQTSEYALVSLPIDIGGNPGQVVFGGTWFMAANSGFGAGPSNITSLALQGTGFLDDLVITNGNVLAVSGPTWTIESTAGAGGTIYPAGTLSIAEGEDITFTVYTNVDYAIDDVLVDGVSVGATNSYTFFTVTTNHTIAASFSYAGGGLYTTKGVDHSWMDSFSLTDYEVDQDIDQDVDGALTWEEYVAGTDPTDSNSVFRVLDVSYLGTTNRVTWYGTLDSGVTNYFSMLRSTNLTASAPNTWDLIESNSIPRDASGTNVWFDTNVPSNAPSFYQPTILWNW